MPMTLDEARRSMPPMFTVYERPKDFPSGYVVRRWFGETCEPHAYTFPDIGAARQWIRQEGGSFPMPRSDGDDSVIVETWL
jgi:hypothetical protein